MRMVMVVDRTEENPELEAAARATGADVARVRDIEDAVTAARDGTADVVLSTATEVARLAAGPGQISSYLRHQIMNPLTTILGYAQLLALDVARDRDADRAKLETIVAETLRIRDLIAGKKAGDDAG